MKTFNISAGIAAVSFGIGTLLLLFQLATTENNMLPAIGLYYVFAAVVVNSIVLLTLIGKLFIDKNYLEILKSMGIILANIPIALLYFFIVVEYTL